MNSKYQIRLHKSSGKHWEKPPEPRDGSYLKTLHEWGALPEVAPVLNVARLFAALSGQNPAAIEHTLKEAIENQEVRFYGWSNGYWKEDSFSLGQDALVSESEMHYDVEIENAWTLNWDSMGLRPTDAVLLFAKRGRKVPHELMEFLPAAPAVSDAAEAPAGTAGTVKPETTDQRRSRRLQRLRALGGDMERVGGKWVTAPAGRGALAALAREEKAAGRPRSDKTDIRKDLSAAAELEAKEDKPGPSSWCPVA